MLLGLKRGQDLPGLKPGQITVGGIFYIKPPLCLLPGHSGGSALKGTVKANKHNKPIYCTEFNRNFLCIIIMVDIIMVDRGTKEN